MKSLSLSPSTRRIAAALSICCGIGVVTSSQQALAATTPEARQTIEPSTSVRSGSGSPVFVSQQETLPTLPSSLSQPVSPALRPASDAGNIVPPGVAPTTAIGWENEYVLGPGDEIRIDVFGAPEYGGDFVLLPDGTVSLPVTGQIALGGLTLPGASEAIAQRYMPYLRSPQVALVPTTLRPLQIGVVGAVGRPGTYTVPIRNNGAVTFPRLTDALRLAGGISSRADIRQIEVYRPDRFGQAQVLQVNLWNLLKDGNMSSDIVLRSGDTVAIPVAEVIDPAEAAQLGDANFSPEEVTVFVVGEVGRPGPVQVSPNTPLNQVLLAVGGFDAQRADRDVVGLIRLNPDGSVERREVAVNLSDGINEETNPLLREDDVLIVARSGLATFSDTVGLAVNPVGRLLGTFFSIFNFLD
ncbi:polysaccharide biosynthesis/export family protein [cf. Phormidesmis sp. LEGE 11477]|uniref:polysaccharide biosynthesis/export family protein n=1 Tax=cf. Phormidesmis sp. LEGE 11477 TaxID=1828680 RepID=UPI0018819F7A|nr:polysaccharide biosynthesis/export family protein [cf. Phormidesmis sp. LEGE 11477]MBE9062338.1 polysaccharide biosynthesis/export family protein [cf. Phormidesmis sp. LEGE 11477]